MGWGGGGRAFLHTIIYGFDGQSISFQVDVHNVSL